MPTYHMRRTDRQIADSDELRRILQAGKYAVIAMCRGDEPYAVTLSYGYDAGRQALYFHCAREGLKIEFLERNPKVCATVVLDQGYVGGKCTHRYQSVVLRGEMRLVQHREEKEHGLDVLLSHLEKDPAPIKARNITSEASYDKFALLRLDITEMTGKHAD